MSMFQNLINKTDAEIIELFNDYKSIRQIMKALGFKSSDSRAQKYLSTKKKELNIITSEYQKKLDRIINEDNLEIIKQAAQESSSISQLIAKLNLIPHAYIFTYIKNFLQQHDISCNVPSYTWTSDRVYCIQSDFPRGYLNKRLRKDNLMPYSCGICGNTGIWNNKPLTLQVDHINGMPNDNRIENLRWLCPNCHAQTSTWAGKNIKH